MDSICQSVDEMVSCDEERNIKCLLDRVRNGELTEDRNIAMLEIQEVVSKSSAGQKNFGAVGFQVILNILKESDNVYMVTDALLTLLDTLTPINHEKGSADEVQPHVMNSDLLFQEENSISLLLGLSSHEDFYVRYYTLKVLKALLTNSPQKLTVAMLDIFRIQQLMNMCADCHELIQYEALWLLFSLNREAEVSQAEEIQKILVSQGAFEMIFSIIKEGGSEGEAVQVWTSDLKLNSKMFFRIVEIGKLR
ncbi:golgin candidate 6 [Capsicum annuum]|uniref:golgin candidate 6 n=1 Tax=Capsicum annuum TaxID=4072 RepID=UPI001FB0FDA4|nr:golgin candidate 6 [Capsicum annuum]